MIPDPRPRARVVRTTAVAVALAVAGCADDPNSALDPSLIHTVGRSDLVISIRERGELSAAEETKINSELEGRATLIYLVPEGTYVDEGTKVAELDASPIVEKLTLERITVAKAEAAVEQARKNVEIMETELLAAEGEAESQLEIARLRARKLMGQARAAGAEDAVAGTNAQVVEELRSLVEDDGAIERRPGQERAGEANELGSLALDRAERARRPVSPDLVEKVLALFEGEENLALQMGEVGNQILQQISQINLARSDLEVAADTLAYSEQLATEGFMTRNELSRDRIDYQRRIAETNLAWNNLDLLVNYTLPEQKITGRQAVVNAELTLASVRASGEARRVREQSMLQSAESEYDVARERLATWEGQIEKAVMYAPNDGLVVYGRFDWDEPVYEGLEVRERQEIVLLPEIQTMIAELLVHEAQIDQVSVGQAATMRIDAFSDREFPAEVTSVSSLPDIRGSWRRDVKVYAVEVELLRDNSDGKLRPGMNSTIRIDVGTLEDVIAIPLPALERRGDQHYVWEVTEQGPVATEVTVGSNNLTQVEIVAGLDVGDRICLVPPPGKQLPRGADEGEAERAPGMDDDATPESGEGAGPIAEGDESAFTGDGATAPASDDDVAAPADGDVDLTTSGIDGDAPSETTE